MCRREVLAVSLMVRTVTRVRTAAIGLTANRLAGAGFTGSREAQHAAFGGSSAGSCAPSLWILPSTRRTCVSAATS